MSALVAAVKKVWATEPIRVLYIAAAVVTFVAAKFGVVVDAQSLLDSVLLVLPIVGLGEWGRMRVVPLGKLRVPLRGRAGKSYTAPK